MNIVGVINNKIYVDETFVYVDTHGMPLSALIDTLSKSSILIHWPSFILDGLSHGWTYKTLVSRIREGIQDSLTLSHSEKYILLDNIMFITSSIKTPNH